jgi:hypothetical protein
MRARTVLTALATITVVYTRAWGGDAPVDAGQRRAAVDGIARALRGYYVFPEVGERTAKMMTQKLVRGFYTEPTTDAFAAALTRDLQEWTKDRHLRVRFDPDFRGSADPDAEPTAEQLARFREMFARENFGVNKVEVLPGNVGLVDLRGFPPMQLAADVLSAAMSLVARTDALIVDLRHNGGGDPETVAFLATYFFPEGSKVHLNDIYSRTKNKTEEFWIRASVPGSRYDRPVWLLTSARTFSGGEEFAYDLQTQKRATLIGETTGGGANPGGPVPVGGGFVAFIPTGRAINAVTKTNWEGTGVKPDLAAPAPGALKLAHAQALRAILKAEKDAERRQALERALATLDRQVDRQP